MDDIAIFLNSTIPYIDAGLEGFCVDGANVCLMPVRYLFEGKTVSVIHLNQEAGELDVFSHKKSFKSDERNVLATALMIAAFVPGLILGFIFKVLALLSEDVRDQYETVKTHLRLPCQTLASEDHPVDQNGYAQQIQHLKNSFLHRKIPLLIVYGDQNLLVHPDDFSWLEPRNVILSGARLNGHLDGWSVNNEYHSVEEALPATQTHRHTLYTIAQKISPITSALIENGTEFIQNHLKEHHFEGLEKPFRVAVIVKLNDLIIDCHYYNSESNSPLPEFCHSAIETMKQLLHSENPQNPSEISITTIKVQEREDGTYITDHRKNSFHSSGASETGKWEPGKYDRLAATDQLSANCGEDQRNQHFLDSLVKAMLP